MPATTTLCWRTHLAHTKQAFHAMIGGKFAALTILDADSIDMETLIDTFNTTVNDTASEILGKHRPVKKPCVTADLLDLCDKRRERQQERTASQRSWCRRGRSHDKRPTDYLQQDLADRGVAQAVDPISHHYPPKERQPIDIPELSYHQSHQPPEQSYADILAEST